MCGIGARIVIYLCSFDSKNDNGRLYLKTEGETGCESERGPLSGSSRERERAKMRVASVSISVANHSKIAHHVTIIAQQM